MEGMMQTGDRPAFEQPQWTLDDVMEETARAVQVVHAAGGDTRKLSPAHRANVLAGLCKALGLNPLTNPIIYVVLNGKEVVYVTRQATDQIAARLKLRRETIAGPEVRDFGGTKLLFCQVRVTAPDGRSEVATATLPVTDLVNAVMKIETKAKRRATLSIAGLGMLGEEDVESATTDDPTFDRSPGADVAETEAERAFYEELADCTTHRDAVGAWLRCRAGITEDGDAVRARAYEELVSFVRRYMETSPSAAKKFIKTALGEHDAKLMAERAAKAEFLPPPADIAEAQAAVDAIEAREPPTVGDYAAQLPRCATLDEVANLWRGARAEIAKGNEGDRRAAWNAAVARLAEIMRVELPAPHLATLLTRKVRELDGDPPPTGTDGPGASDPAASPIGDRVAEANAQRDAAPQASARPRPERTSTEAQLRAYLATKGSRTELANAVSAHGERMLGTRFEALAVERAQAVCVDRDGTVLSEASAELLVRDWRERGIARRAKEAAAIAANASNVLPLRRPSQAAGLAPTGTG